MAKAIERVTRSCHHCASLQQVPHTLVEQSTGDPPEIIGGTFAADVIKRDRQLLLLVRETVTSFTGACIISDEKRTSLRNALIQLCIELHPLDGPCAIIHTDTAPGFVALVNDELLRHHRISIDIGRIKNPNKNPVAEKAVRELEDELLRQEPGGGQVTPLTLATAVARLNSRLRSQGLSARELLTQRDQFTQAQLPISDRAIILEQHSQREVNHAYSEKTKAPQGKPNVSLIVEVGDLVYLHARDRYLVVSTDNAWCYIRKFTGSQLRNMSYKVKRSECYKVPNQSPSLPMGVPCGIAGQESCEEEEQSKYDCVSSPHIPAPVNSLPPAPPHIPRGLSVPPLSIHSEVMCDPDLVVTETPPDLVVTETPHSSNQPGDLSYSMSNDSTSVCEGDTFMPRRSSRMKRPPKHLDDYEL
jgi:hypothetical protein